MVWIDGNDMEKAEAKIAFEKMNATAQRLIQTLATNKNGTGSARDAFLALLLAIAVVNRAVGGDVGKLVEKIIVTLPAFDTMLLLSKMDKSDDKTAQ